MNVVVTVARAVSALNVRNRKMQITKEQLKRIIKEEIEAVIGESEYNREMERRYGDKAKEQELKDKEEKEKDEKEKSDKEEAGEE